jgi:phage baseplate assembly protein W
MANRMLAIRGRDSLSVDDRLDVYVDLDSSSGLNSSMQEWPALSADFLSAAEAGLSAVGLSCYSEDAGEIRPVYTDDVEPRPATGADALEKYVATYGEVQLPAGGDGMAEAMFGALSGSGALFGVEYDDGTVGALGRCCDAALAQAETAAGARQYEWRRRVSVLVNVNAVRNSIRQIFTWVPGERIINPEFGSRLRLYLYEPITEENQERIVAEIKAAVMKWEPRVTVDRVVKVTDVSDVEENTVRLDIYYTIKGLNGRQFKYEYEYSRARYSKI